MSYGVMAYLVKTEDLLKPQAKKSGLFCIFGSKKNNINQTIIERHSEELDEIDVDIEDDGSLDSSLRSREILNELITNSVSGNSYSSAYGYVFKVLCEYHGEFLDNYNWYPCDPDSFYEIPFMSSVLPIKFPIPDDFPGLGFVDHKKIKADKIESTILSEDQIQSLKSWFALAIERQADIYLFYH